jgi:hypothetical protein
LYPGRALETTKALKIKRNNVNRYACRRINTVVGNCADFGTKYSACRPLPRPQLSEHLRETCFMLAVDRQARQRAQTLDPKA